MSKSIETNIDYKNKLEALIELAHTLQKKSNFSQILEIVTEKACEFLAADFTILMMTNPQTQNTIKTVFSGRDETSDDEIHAINSSISGWVIKYKRILYGLYIELSYRRDGIR